MNRKEQLTQKFILVNMNEIEISTEEKPIIGTEGLVSCIGFILYNKEHQKAIVGHMSADKIMSDIGLDEIRLDIFKKVYENKLNNTKFDLMLIEGAYKSEYEKCFHELEILKDSYRTKYPLLDILEENIKRVKNIQIDSVNKSYFSPKDFQVVDENGNLIYNQLSTLSKRFAFDASTGKFVTDKVLFEEEYSKVNNRHIR